MRRQDQKYESGLVERMWLGECTRCGARVHVHRREQAKAWEVAHAQCGCGRTLVPDESGRGWVPSHW
ncbi:hypothetical protein [Pseudonocardia sp. D17]|jgi:hypothetical protein|uniref:hypothetical protein n=1 Tax=Pseudonocardia sp. D17 TaxID=882661 RepID=UPI002B38AF85|nr:hypothetical protein PSD17_14090 [Pseudonocardia sp. D17]